MKAYWARRFPTPEARAAEFRRITKGKRADHRGANHWAANLLGGDPRLLVLRENGKKTAAKLGAARKIARTQRRIEACALFYLNGLSVEAVAAKMGLQPRTITAYIDQRLTAETIARMRALKLG